MPTYCGSAKVVEKDVTPEGRVWYVTVTGPESFEVEADSERQAEELIRAAAKRNRLWPRGGSGHLLMVDVWEKGPPERHYYGFRFSVDSPQLARTRGFRGIREYLPGQLYVFYDRESRDAWVAAGRGPYDVRKAVKASALPRGWRHEDAFDPETEEPLPWRPFGRR